MEYTLDGSILHLLHRAAQSANDLFAAEIKSADLTARQFVILLAISADEGASQTQLVARTGVDRSTLADVVSRLQRKGLLHREPAMGDARAYAVRLTPEGREALNRAMPIAARVDQEMVGAIPKAEYENWLRTTRALAALSHKNGETAALATVGAGDTLRANV